MLELSKIISAVKPRDLTSQYKILAALYCLNAHAAPVTTKQITDLLKVQLSRKDVPQNISASLVAYKAFVDPTEKGPPRLWSLTQKGLEQLRSLSGLALAAPSIASDFLTDVGIVCALEYPELAAITNALGGPTRWTVVGDARFPHVYRQADFSLLGNKHLKIVSITATSMGLTAAAIATTHLILQFRPRIVIMVGIAAGTRSSDKQFGDVLVADPSVDYNSGKVAQSGGIREFLPDPYPIGLNMRVRSLLQKYRDNHPVFETIRGRWTGSLPPKSNRLHIGPLSAVAQKWMRRSGFNASQLTKIFSVGGDEIDLIAESLPGKSRREKMLEVILLKGIAAYLGTGAARVSHQQIKETCLHYNAFDSPNFAKNLKDFSAEVTGTKESGYTLTPRGLNQATELVKSLVKGNE